MQEYAYSWTYGSRYSGHIFQLDGTLFDKFHHFSHHFRVRRAARCLKAAVYRLWKIKAEALCWFNVGLWDSGFPGRFL